MAKKEFSIIIIGLGLIILIVSFSFLLSKRTPEVAGVDVLTEKKEYQSGEALRLKIENNLRESICFSSCFPYYFEKEDGSWESYHYVDCPNSNLTEGCINQKQSKAYEIIIPALKKGIHRLALPACLNCGVQEKFKEDKWFYSNDFVIK